MPTPKFTARDSSADDLTFSEATAVDDRAPRSRLYRLGAWSARNRIKVLVAWLLVCAAAALFAIGGIGGETLFQRLQNGAPDVRGQAAQADALLSAAEGPQGTKLTLLINGVDPLDDDLARELNSLPGLVADVENEHPGTTVKVSDPRKGLAAIAAGVELPPADATAVRAATASDGQGIIISAEISGATDTAKSAAVSGALTALDRVADQVRAAEPGATVYVSSDSRIAGSYRQVAGDDLERGEGIALPVALLLMVVVFGGFLAAGLPLAGALVSIGTGFGALYLMSYFMGFDSMVINVISLLGLGLAIDYGLLIISRFREEMRAVAAGDRSGLVHGVAMTCERAGRTVIFSGVIFAAASIGLVMFEPSIMKAIGLGVIAVVLIAVLLSITFLPALLAVGGFRVARPGALVRLFGKKSVFGQLGEPAAEDGPFGRIARWAQRRPALTTIISLLILAAIASPALAMTATNDVSGALPRAASQFGFVDAINADFPDAARPQVKLVVTGDPASDPAAVAEAWATALRADPAVTTIGTATQVGAYTTVVIHPTDGTALDVARQARDLAPDARGIHTWVTGSAAHDLDLISSVKSTAPWAAAVIILATFILLFLMTGSVLMPLKSLFIAVFSLGAAVGVLVWGFQEGNLAGVLGFAAADVNGVDILVLTITLVLGFGLSMDYEVFLLGRVAEHRNAGVPGGEAVWRGLQGTGKIITSAALIMVVVFLGFTVGDLLVIKQMGTALAVLVVLDATLVRLVLVPALMTWGERIMWWSPRWLRPLAARFRIHH